MAAARSTSTPATRPAVHQAIPRWEAIPFGGGRDGPNPGHGLMPGPGKKKNAIRRNLGPDWKILPAGGYDGDTPAWPMDGSTTKERDLWSKLWETPQAAVWAELGWTRIIARYVTLVVMSEASGDEYDEEDDGGRSAAKITAALLSEIRQMEDRLGLTPLSMKRLQWEIEGDEEEVDEGDDDNVVELFG